MTKATIYEHPLNERVRILLRLEHLFSQASHFLGGATAWDSRMFISTLMEILDVFGRSDLKTELMKEVERATGNLGPLLQIPEVDHDRLKSILVSLEQSAGSLHGLTGQLGQDLREDDFLTVIRQRVSIPGGTCDFDLPGYHFWLERPVELRRADQENWFDKLEVVRRTVELLLMLVRSSAEPRERIANQGMYQQGLDPNTPYQLIRILLSADLPYFAEVSGGRHRFTIRFLQPGAGRPVPTNQDVDFHLSCCSL